MDPSEVLVDTSVVVDVLHGDQALAAMLNARRPVYVPVIVLAELLAGARRSKYVLENVEQVQAFVADSKLLGCDSETASHYADINNELRVRGRPIPQNDMWIAAVARQHGLTVASRDAHFDEVPSIRRVPC